jgi:hypothetical protein
MAVRSAMVLMLLATLGVAGLFAAPAASSPSTTPAAAAVATPAVPSFVNDVVPVLTRLGCSAGGCHGKIAGKGGFRLSLWGFAPEVDYETIARESFGRRINPTAPQSSLLILKGSGQMPHGGGRRMEIGSPAYRLLTDWIAAGAPGPHKEEAHLQAIAVAPSHASLKLVDKAQLRVEATYSDGSKRDVTWMTRFESNDPGVASVTPDGLVVVQRHGESAVRATLAGQVEIALVTAPYEKPIPDAKFAGGNNYIDDHVMAKLREMRIEPAALCDDATFLRRVSLDLIGTLPDPAEVAAFVADTATDKRTRIVDALMQRPQFVDYWAIQFGDTLQNRKNRDHDSRGLKGVRQMHQWLRQQVATNRPWDQVAREVVTASGSAWQSPAAGWIIVAIDDARPEESDLTAAVAQTFLGTRITCARCHNHPLEKYTQDDFYHLTAFFSRIWLDRKNPDDGPTTILLSSEHGFNLARELRERQARLDAAREKNDAKQVEELQKQIESTQKQIGEESRRPAVCNQPRTGQPLSPQPLDRSDLKIEPGSDPRVALADWMTGPGKNYFARNMVNRLWRHFMGVGLVEPADDIRPTNPPSNAPLFNAMADQFIASGYDTQKLMKQIVASRAYQLASKQADASVYDTRYYSYFHPRRLEAEQMIDGISRATGVPDSFPGYPVGISAIQLADPIVDSYFLRIFGRSERTTFCACERDSDVSLPQVLHLFNGDMVVAKIKSPEGRLAALLKNPDDAAVARELFLAAVGRPPTQHEIDEVARAIAGADRREAFEDLFWALLNSKEFAFNH